jgi:hypothetical protein
MGKRHRTHRRDEKFPITFVRKLRERAHLENLNKHQKVILKEILKK